MASSTDQGSLVVSSNLTSTIKTLLKESEFPHVKNVKILLDPQKLEPRVGDKLTRISCKFQGGRVL